MSGAPELYPYQRVGVNFIVSNRRVILGDEMGLGKTVQALMAVDKAKGNPTLIVVGLKIAFGVWQDEIKKWLGKKSVVYTGTPYDRIVIWEEWDPDKVPYFITNTAMLREVLGLKNKWRSVIFDEYHLMGLRNRKSNTFAFVKKNLYSGMLILCSGSPVSQGPQDLWGPLHLLQPKRFTSFWHFINYYGYVEKDYWGGRQISRYPGRPKELRNLLQAYMIRRKKKEVLGDLPEKTRQILPIDMEPKQATLYRRLAESMLVELEDGEIVVTPSVVAQLVKLRQLLVSPELIGSDAPSAGLRAILDHSELEFEAGNSVAVFTPFRAGVLAVEKAFKRMPGRKKLRIFTIMGQMEQEEVDNKIRDFQRIKGDKVLICTIKSAVSFTAHAASVAYFLGQEWDQNDNDQAENRLHRIGQKNPVRSYYLVHRHTIEEHVLEVLEDKHNAMGIILNKNRLLPS